MHGDSLAQTSTIGDEPMGEVLKFRRPRRRFRPSLPMQAGTIILFTGIWYGRLPEPETQPKRNRRTRQKVAQDALLPEPTLVRQALPQKSVRKRRTTIQANPVDNFSV
jgi:hypothetical protein